MTDKEKQQIEEIRVKIWHENTTLSEVCDYIFCKQQEVRKETAKEIFNKLIKIAEDEFKGLLLLGVLKAWALEYGVEIE